jgi:hypothetical protein
MRSSKIFLTSVIITIFLQFPIFANSKNYSAGLTSFNEIYTTAKKLTADKYPNADSITVNNLTIDKYNPDGTGNSWNDNSTKIFTEKGRESNTVQSFPFSANYSKLELTLVEVIKPDGSIKKIDIAKQSKTAISTSQMSSNIYDPSNKVLTVNIPTLKVGDTIRCISHSTTFKVPIPKSWYNIVLFEDTNPIHHIQYTILAPHSLPLKKIALLSKIKNTVKFEKTESISNITYNWTGDNIPRMFPEPQMPAISSVVQRLIVSTIPDWKSISKWYWNLCKPHMHPTTEMKIKTKELIKNTKTEKQKIKNIFNFVSQKIRYMGLIAEQKSPGMEPHDVKLTFDNRYGVCRDKAVLLTEMLRLAGFKAYPVLIKVGPKLDKEVPLPYFNHAITCVELNGKSILMDPTNENTKDILPAYLGNLSYIVAKPSGSSLKTSLIIPANKNMMQINTNGIISKDGNLKAISTIHCHGINDTIYRSFLSRMTPAQLEQLFDKLFRYIIPTARVTKLDISPKNLQNTEKNIKLTVSYTASNEIISGKKNAMLSIPWIGKSLGFVSQVIQATALEKRKYPLVTDFTCGYNENINLKLDDPTLKLIHRPKYKPFATNILTYNQNIRLVDNSNNINHSMPCSNSSNKSKTQNSKKRNNDKYIVGQSNLSVNGVEFSPKQYLELKHILKSLEIDKKKKLIFSVKPKIQNTVKSDSIILNENTDITINNPHSWTEKYSIVRKILTYNGKKDFSEIKIVYNPKWEKVKILNAEVINKNGKITKLNSNRINLMDMPWVSSAPRYSGGKILVANLPSVEVGSTIKYSIEKTVIRKPFFSTEIIFQSFAPLKNYSYSITFPKSMKPNIYKYKTDSVVESTKEDSNNIFYTWKVKNIPAIKKISSLPPSFTFLPTIMISFDSWKNYSILLYEKLKSVTENQKAVHNLTDKLIKNKKTDKEKITAIRNFTSKHIRTDGPTFVNLPLNSISNADDILKDGYGNNMDNAVLLYSMLKYCNFSPEFILVSEYPYLDKILRPLEKNTQRTLFNNALIKVTLENNKTIYLNDTDEYSILGTTLHENCIGYNLSKNRFTKILPENNKSDKIQVYYNLTIANDGKAYLDVTKKYYGNIYSDTKEMFEKMLPEEKKRYYQQRMANISQLAMPASKLYTNFKKYPGIEKYAANIKNYATIENNFCYFSLPLMLQFIINLDGNNRDMPFFISDSQNIEFYIKIKLPKEYKDILIHPESAFIDLPSNSGHITINCTKTTNNTYEEIIKIHLNPAIYSPEAYQELLTLNKKLSSQRIKTFLLKKAPSQKK